MAVLEDNLAQQAADRIVEVLKEFADKLNRMRDRSIALRRDPLKGDNAGRAQQAWNSEWFGLSPRLLELIRHTSQMIEHGDVDHTTRVELALRLGEIEGLRSAIETLRF